MYSEGYPRELDENEIHRGDHSHAIEDAQNWSYEFGHLLHDCLSHDTVQMSGNRLWAYAEWLKTLKQTEANLVSLPPENAIRARNELNFHMLNRHMLGLWLPLEKNTWESESYRQECISAAESHLAMEGVRYYIFRERYAKKFGSETLYTPEHKKATQMLTGIAQEIDTGIILMDIAKQYKDLTFVPAPLQFERTKKERNVDFVAVNIHRKTAIGLQVKSVVTNERYDRYDPEYVVMVDGDCDMNNIKAVRTVKGKSDKYVMSWPGMIAARRIVDLKPQNLRGMASVNRDAITKLKFHARDVAGNIRVDYRDISRRIGERIMEHL